MKKANFKKSFTANQKKSRLYTSKQVLAWDLKQGLGDKKKGAFGIYITIIKKYGQQKCRSVLSDTLYDYRKGDISNPVRVFLYRISHQK